MTPPLDDIDRLMAVMAAAFDPAYGEAWTRRQVEDALVIGNCHYILVDATGAAPAPDTPAAGFSLSRTGFEEEELLLFAVAPQYRGRGLGKTMLAMLAADARGRGARRLLLEMRRGNGAEALYRQFGFTPIGLRPNYYRMHDGSRVDAITFAATIDPAND
ncbi:MAG: GNAT family N-acetyltransferase [Novosphingobium sp.]|jgi:ribosomal-protein-alanine N-acetyltransferase|nr:GNAT family N-acetyltransferase [Novosphingobium sp.]